VAGEYPGFTALRTWAMQFYPEAAAAPVPEEMKGSA